MDTATKKDTAEFVARFAAEDLVVLGTMPASCGCSGTADTVRFKATLGTSKASPGTQVELEVPRSLPDGVTIERRPLAGASVEYVLAGADGKEWKPRLRVTESRDASGKYEVYAGQYDDGNGRVVDLLVWTDPVPVVVIYGIGAAVVCGLISLIDKWTSDCAEELATTIQACVARGGIPVFHGYVTVGVNPFEGSFGCSFQCVWDRCEFPPAGAQVHKPMATTTVTTTHPDGTTTTTTTTRIVEHSSHGPASRRTCASEYPDALRCEDFGRAQDRFDSFEELERAVRRGAGLPENARLSADKRAQKSHGPCPELGYHWDFRYNGKHVGSAFECPCCTDTPNGPVGSRKYLYNA